MSSVLEQPVELVLSTAAVSCDASLPFKARADVLAASPPFLAQGGVITPG